MFEIDLLNIDLRLTGDVDRLDAVQFAGGTIGLVARVELRSIAIRRFCKSDNGGERR